MPKEKFYDGKPRWPLRILIEKLALLKRTSPECLTLTQRNEVCVWMIVMDLFHPARCRWGIVFIKLHKRVQSFYFPMDFKWGFYICTLLLMTWLTERSFFLRQLSLVSQSGDKSILAADREKRGGVRGLAELHCQPDRPSHSQHNKGGQHHQKYYVAGNFQYIFYFSQNYT